MQGVPVLFPLLLWEGSRFGVSQRALVWGSALPFTSPASWCLHRAVGAVGLWGDRLGVYGSFSILPRPVSGHLQASP